MLWRWPPLDRLVSSPEGLVMNVAHTQSRHARLARPVEAS